MNNYRVITASAVNEFERKDFEVFEDAKEEFRRQYNEITFSYPEVDSLDYSLTDDEYRHVITTQICKIDDDGKCGRDDMGL